MTATSNLLTNNKDNGKLFLVKTIDEMRNISENIDRQGLKINLVPTMGALHKGHASLIKQAKQHDRSIVVVSIFVNSMQFNNQEDLIKYPSTLEQDLNACGKLGVDYVFAPSTRDIYPEGTDSFLFCHVEPAAKYSSVLEGVSRPGHFAGMLTVVNKLFNIVRPRRAYFGEKDYQQLMLVKKMVFDLNMFIDIIGVDTVRDDDFLPLSSRNIRLGIEERLLAARLLERLMKGMIDMVRCPKILQQLSQDTLELDKMLDKTLEPLGLTPSERKLWTLDYIEIRCERHFNKLRRSSEQKAYDCDEHCLEISDKQTVEMPVRILSSIIINDVKLLDNIKTNMIQNVY